MSTRTTPLGKPHATNSTHDHEVSLYAYGLDGLGRAHAVDKQGHHCQRLMHRHVYMGYHWQGECSLLPFMTYDLRLTTYALFTSLSCGSPPSLYDLRLTTYDLPPCHRLPSHLLLTTYRPRCLLSLLLTLRAEPSGASSSSDPLPMPGAPPLQPLAGGHQ